MNTARAIPTFALIAALSACNSTGLVSRDVPLEGVNAPGMDIRGEAVDPLIVADRLLAAGEPELALSSYIQAASADGLTPGILRAMASANLQLGRLGQAERLLRDALKDVPEDAAIWNDLGVVLLEKGNVGEAHQAFRRAFALDPNTPQILANLHLSLEKLGSVRYAEVEEEETFALTRRQDGVFELSAVE